MKQTKVASDASSRQATIEPEVAMKPGVHVIEQRLLHRTNVEGLIVPKTRLGVFDLVRTIEGLLPEPPSRTLLGVTGLDAVLTLKSSDSDAIHRRMCSAFRAGAPYFEWRRIPLVFLIRGSLVAGDIDGEGLCVRVGERRVALAPLLGSRLVLSDESIGWWWSPRLG